MNLTAYAAHLLPPHQPVCSASFPCSEEITKRVRFWIEVFQGWGEEVAILHDPNAPERVYAVINTGYGCGKKASRRIKANRKSISASLNALATNISKGRKISNQKEQHLLTLFPSNSPSEIRKSAKEIRCQGGVRDSFIKGLRRFNRYADLVDRVLAKYQLPEDIRYLPFVESSYNPAAYSKVGAAGLWQIMPATARSLGLELNATLDERLDPEAATEAAAKYFIDATKRLGRISKELKPNISDAELNPFIITSYNYGINGMRRAIKAVGPDFVEVLERYKSPSFRVAVKNFYASFLAARHVALHSKRYFGNLVDDPPRRYQTLVLDHATSMDRIKKVFNLSEKDLKPLNLPLTRYIWNGWRLAPAGYRLRLPWKKHRWRQQLQTLKSLAPENVVPGGSHYVVRKGDTACGIASALRVNCRTLIKANNLNKRATIRIGQKLVIPVKVSLSSQSTETNGGSRNQWTVKKGDTACGIAKAVGVSCRELIRFNRLGRKAKIRIGQTLKIPGGDYLASNPSELNADNRYVVRKNDAACKIAQRFSVGCQRLIAINNLDRRATIYPGQKLIIPGFETQKTTETAGSLASVQTAPDTVTKQKGAGTTRLKKRQPSTVQSAGQLLNLLDSLPDLSVQVDSASGEPEYFIYVEIDETLGHFADWLGIGSSSGLRKLNNIRRSASLKLGQRIVLPKPSAKTVSRFEQLRTDYHQVLSENLKENFELAGVEAYTVKKGESLWELSRRNGFPLWLLYRLNPELRVRELAAGKSINLPQLRVR